MRELVEKRISLLFKRQFSMAQDVSFGDIFPHKIGKHDPFDYMLERTLMRPRDVITFVNECLDRAAGHYEVTANSIQEAERNFSRTRRQALEYEWQSAFPSLPKLLEYIASVKKTSISFLELCDRDAVESLAYSICTEARIDFDPLYPIGNRVFNERGSHHERFMKEVVSVLYRVGAVGVKLKSGERNVYSHMDLPVLATEEISQQTQVRIHPMLHRSLGIGERAS